MSLTKCTECDHQISTQAVACPSCGNTTGSETSGQTKQFSGAWHSVTQTKTPINVFAFAMMTCASILGASSTQVDNICDLTAFTYTLHIFLAISGMFFVTLLFSRKSMYHPQDLINERQAGKSDHRSDNPLIAAVLIGIMLAGYAIYQSGIGQNREAEDQIRLELCLASTQSN